MTPELEGLYDVVRNVDDELLFCIRARTGVPDYPRLFYDGSNKAVLRRDKKRMILLDHLPTATQKQLRTLEVVLFAEIMDNELEREYEALVTKVRKLPS
ncbi:MAG: hypothetical protein AB7U85_01335 [Alphaproteobacteria bacterium]